MSLIQLLSVLPLLYSFACANVIPRETATIPRFLNISSTSTQLAPPATTSKCCFLVQDLVSEVWWEQTSYEYTVRNITSFSTFITLYPNTTVVNVNSTVTTTTLTNSELIGANPLTLARNRAPNPAETASVLNQTGSVTTGGTVIQSPAAFYVYNTVRIITADALTDDGGNLQCGKPASDDEGNFDYGLLNPNAQEYFGSGPNKPRDVEATPTDEAVTAIATTDPVTPAPSPAAPTAPQTAADGTGNTAEPTPTVLSLTEPFVYAPDIGRLGKTKLDGKCLEPGGTEQYGFIPQTLLSYLFKNEHYVSQYPNLRNCLAGGPSIIPKGKICPSIRTTTRVEAVGGPLTTNTIIYVTPPGRSTPKQTPEPAAIPIPIIDNKPGNGGSNDNPIENKPTQGGGNDNNGDNKGDGQSSTNNGITNGANNINTDTNNGNTNGGNTGNAGQANAIPANKNNGNAGENNSGSGSAQPQNSGSSHQNSGNSGSTPATNDPTIGDIINQIIGGPPRANRQSSPANAQPNDIVYSSPTNIPVANAPPGVTGELKTIGGTPVFAITAPTTFAGPAVLPFGGGTIGSTKNIGGTPYIIIPGPTNIPVSAAPAGIQGTYTQINGQEYVVVPSSQTYAANTGQITGTPVWGHGIPTTIAGVPFIVYPKTDIPLLEAAVYGITSTVASATKTIDGTPYIALAGPTTVPARDTSGFASQIGAKTTLVDGTPLLVLPSATPIPLSAFPDGLDNAQTTSISGTPYLILPSQTSVTLPLQTDSTKGGQLTVIIDGSSRLIIAGPKTVPVNDNFDIQGSTTVIRGSTMVVVTGATTVSLKTKTSSSSTATSTATPNPASPAPTQQAPNSGVGRVEGSVLVVVGVLIVELLL